MIINHCNCYLYFNKHLLLHIFSNPLHISLFIFVVFNNFLECILHITICYFVISLIFYLSVCISLVFIFIFSGIVSAWEKRNSQPQVTKAQTTPSEKSNITPKQSDALLIESSGKDENKKQQEQSQKQKEKQLPAPSQQGNSEVPTSQKSKESLEQTVSRNKTVEIVQEKKEPAKDKGAMHGDKDKKKDSEKEKAEKQKRESEKLLKEKREKEKREKELQEKEKNKNKTGTFDPKNKKESTQKGSSVPTLTNYTIPKKTVNDRPQKMSAMQRKRERPMKFQNSQSLEMGSNFRFQSKNQRLKSKQNQSPLKFYGNDREPFAKRRRMGMSL